jgi:hypothetical protein
MSDISFKALTLFFYTLVIFLIGFSVGNVKSGHKRINEELVATEKLLKAQGDKPEVVEATLAVIKADKLKELGGAKRQILSIWLPSILVIINIIFTVLFKDSKLKIGDIPRPGGVR